MPHAVPTQRYAPSGSETSAETSAETDEAAATPVMEPATRGSRAIAMLIDSVSVAVLVAWPLVQGVGMTGWHGLRQGDATTLDNVAASVMQALFGFILWAGLNIHFVRQTGQSIGKKMMGIKVVRSDGSKAGAGRIVWLRNGIGMGIALMGAVVPWIGGLYSLVDALMIFSESRRCLHDRLADTIVIKA